MFDFINKPYPFDSDLRNSLKVGIWMGIGMFLFILFLQPLEIEKTDFDIYILLIAGFGGITFLLISLGNLAIPWVYRKITSDKGSLKIMLLFQLLIWILNAVAFSFYLRYVGKVQLSMFLAFKVVVLSFFPPVINIFISELQNARSQLIILHQRNRELTGIVSNNRKEEHVVEFVSDNRSEKLKLNLKALILVKSAENYVEILYRENDSIQKKLLRTTLKNIEDQLNPYSFIIRCHRTCIVNSSFVESLKRIPTGFRLQITDYEEEIPVSRQYLLGVKSILDISE